MNGTKAIMMVVFFDESGNSISHYLTIHKGRLSFLFFQIVLGFLSDASFLNTSAGFSKRLVSIIEAII
jgi:hypothetical protein